MYKDVEADSKFIKIPEISGKVEFSGSGSSTVGKDAAFQFLVAFEELSASDSEFAFIFGDGIFCCVILGKLIRLSNGDLSLFAKKYLFEN